jgi:hypothetical protein
MSSNLDRYRKDLGSLIARGKDLFLAIQFECFPDEFKAQLGEMRGKDAAKVLSSLPQFADAYQAWYSEARAVVKQLLPDRLADFVRHYDKPKPRKEISYENYRIEDYLQGLTVRRLGETLVGPQAAIPHMRQQLAILAAAESRFESSLFDIRQLVQADLLDSELGTATELAKHGFSRAAGAVAGVVVERHLALVCEMRSIKLTKRNPTIADYNNALKDFEVVDISQWRFVQHLADIRNLCDHDKEVEPSRAQVTDLINGVAKVIKTIM